MTNTPGPQGDDRKRRPEETADPLTATAEHVRSHLRQVVDEVVPAPDALERLHAAVPARRRRRRTAVFSATAAVVVLAVAAPLVRSAASTDSAAAGQTVTDQPATTSESGPPSGPATDLGVRPALTSDATALPGVAPSVSPQAVRSALPTVTNTASSAPTPSTRPCAAGDLQQSAGELGPVGADGIAYGVVVVRNTTLRVCAVTGPGLVMVSTPPGNAPLQVSVTDHVDGDPATRLPAVAPSSHGVTVGPGHTYEFQFAWKPRQPTNSGGSCVADGPAAPVPSLGYTLAEGDVRVAGVPLSAACGGTLYRTDIYPSGAWARG